MTEVSPLLTGKRASCVFLESLHQYKSFDTNYVDFVQKNETKYGHLQLSVSENLSVDFGILDIGLKKNKILCHATHKMQFNCIFMET